MQTGRMWKNLLEGEINYNQIVADQELAIGEFYGFESSRICR
jgi:hypothetical protein